MSITRALALLKERHKKRKQMNVTRAVTLRTGVSQLHGAFVRLPPQVVVAVGKADADAHTIRVVSRRVHL
jgi:hypothetical protein